MNISYSKIHSFLHCPLSYKFAYIDKITPSTAPQIEEGIIAHKILEGLGKREKKERIIEELVKEGKDVNAVLKIEDIILKLPLDFSHTKFVELPFEMEYSEHIIKGRIDRVDFNGEWELIDYKYGSWDYDSSPTLQGLIYSFVWLDKHKLDKVKFSYYDIKRNKRSSRVYTRNDNFNLIKTYIDVIETHHKLNSFPPKPSSNCVNCVFSRHCNAWKEWLNVNMETTKPEDIAIKLIKLGEMDKVRQKEELEMRNFIKKWMDSQTLSVYDYEDWEIINYNDGIVVHKKTKI